MGWLSKAWKGIKKGWDEIDDYVVPIVGGAAIGALTGGLGVAGLGAIGAGTGVSAGTAALAGGSLGALQGLQMGESKVQAEKATAAATAAAERQERLANSAPTAVQPLYQTSQAMVGDDSTSGARKRRYSHSKTTNSGLGLGRYSSATSKRSTRG